MALRESKNQRDHPKLNEELAEVTNLQKNPE